MGALMVVGRLAIVVSVVKWIKSDTSKTLFVLLMIGILCMLGYWYIQYQQKRFYDIETLRRIQFSPSKQIEGLKLVRAGSSDKSYKVHEDLNNPEDASSLMDRLNTTAHTLIDHVAAKYLDGDGLKYIKPHLRNHVKTSLASLKRNYKTPSLEENIPERSGGDTSYVIDKGSVFAMCLRDPKNNNALETRYNSLVFVLIHEMSHLATKSFGHDTSFWENFKFLLQEASMMEPALYNPVNYKVAGSPYCGIVITYSPLFDTGLKDYRV